MLRGGIPIGKAFGTSLRLNYSWFIIFILVTWALSVSYFPSQYPDWSLAIRIVAGPITSFLFFGSVLAHEIISLLRGHPDILNRKDPKNDSGDEHTQKSDHKTAAD